MAVANDILEIRFVGNDVNPSEVKPHEIAQLLIGFEKGLLSEVKKKHPEIDTNALLFSFNEIKDESLGLGFAVKLVRDIIVSTFTSISTSFNTGDFSTISNETIEHLKTLTTFTKKYKCSGEFKLNGELLSSFEPNTEIPFNQNPIIKGDIRLFGKINNSGGDNPNIHLKLSDNQTIIFPASEALVKQLAHKLYEKVSLIGTARWDSVTFEIKDFKLKEILDYAPGQTLNAIKELRNLTKGHWDRFNTNDDINNELLRE